MEGKQGVTPQVLKMETIKDWLNDPTFGKFLVVAGGWLIVWLLVKLIQRLVVRAVGDSSARYRLRKFVAFLGFFAALLVVALGFSEYLGGLTIAFGVAGAGIAFALQEVIASIAGWVAISAGGFYRPGDRVQVGGIVGDVIDVGVLRTTLMETGGWVKGDLYNGRLVRIANSFVFKEPVFNYSADFPFLWDEIVVPIRQGSDWRWVTEMLEKVLAEEVGEVAREGQAAWDELVKRYMIESAQVEPMVTMIVNDNWIEFTARYAVDYKRRRTSKNRLFRRILGELEASGGRAAIASATHEIVGFPEVRLARPAKEP